MRHTFKAGFLFCGLGAGARGFLDAVGRLGADDAAFENAGGIDNDPAACADFEYLTKGRALCADLSTLSPTDLRAFMGAAAPDVLFLSPPCKGFSRLLSTAQARTPRYQALNRLVLQGLFLACETWPAPPSLIVLENVEGIRTRGAELLAQVRQLLASYGYVFHEATHDCGEIGGLAQHRRRYLLVARRPVDLAAYVYRPPKRRVRACGEVLGTLPLPGDPEAGGLHELPRISWVNWVRLALIPAGGDWRDLPGVVPRGKKRREIHRRHAVASWAEPIQTVTGPGGAGTEHIADPRALAEAIRLGQTADGADSFKGRPGLLGVLDWNQPSPAVTGSAQVSGSNGKAAVADPRAFGGAYGVLLWSGPSGTVAGESLPSNGAFSVADPRLAVHVGDPTRGGKLGVVGWDEPAPTVTASMRASGSNTPASIADPRLRCAPRRGSYGVISWQEAASTITGHARIDNGRFAVADPRRPRDVTVPIIVAVDGTWHRPLTTLELAVLQGLPPTVDGAPLRLAGRSNQGWRERIGNAVPVQAAQAIGETLLTALLAGALGTWTLGSTGIWVRQDGRTEDEVDAELGIGGAA